MISENNETGESVFSLRTIFVLAFFILILVVAWIFLFGSKADEEIFVCGDGTFYDTCSSAKPYFCSDRMLLEKVSVCGCPEILKKEGNSCISNYQNSSKEITLKYVLNGEEKEINYVVYEGLVDYLFNLPKGISSNGDAELLRKDFKLKKIDEKEQRELLLPLVIKIQNITGVKKEQAKIAVSLVQNIPYVESEKNYTMRNIVFNYSRYPYEVLYDNAGIFGEKSELLAFLLREIGYEVVIFSFPLINHEGVGVACSKIFDFEDSGYCYIETTSAENLNGLVKSLPEEYEIIPISEGEYFGWKV